MEKKCGETRLSRRFAAVSVPDDCIGSDSSHDEETRKASGAKGKDNGTYSRLKKNGRQMRIFNTTLLVSVRQK